MTSLIEPTTPRLQLRQWRSEDRDVFAEMSADPQVMEFFPGPMTRRESDALADRCESLIAERGWGVWAVELSSTGKFVGVAGLHRPSAKLPCLPCIEVMWRLARPHWGNGYATEAGRAALEVGFEQLDLREIVSFATLRNLRSRAVMERLGMQDSGQIFDHPDLPPSSPLRTHCLYSIHKDQWR